MVAIEQDNRRQHEIGDRRESTFDDPAGQPGAFGGAQEQRRRHLLFGVGQPGAQHVGRARPAVKLCEEGETHEQRVFRRMVSYNRILCTALK